MTDPVVAPYGTWSSPITAEMLATSGIGVRQSWLEDGLAYWIEGRPTEGGRQVIVRGDVFSSPVDVIPEGFNARTKVHEYGGAPYVVHRGVVVFSNFEDQRLYRVTPGAGDPVPITPETDGRHRYADGRITDDGAWWIGVRERHPTDRAADVVNELVVLPTDGSQEPRVIAGGRDFYAGPRISPDGARLCWQAWDLPWMPWDGCELFVADLGADATLGEPRLVAGRDGEESIWQPVWSPWGELHWASDRSGWWNIERERDGERQVVLPMEAEFGWPQWGFGGSSFAFLSDGRIVCHYGSRGVQHTAVLDAETGELMDLDLPYTAVNWPSIAVEGSQILFIAGGPSIPEQVVLLDFTARSVEVLRESEVVDVDRSWLSVPTQVEFPTEGGLTAFAHVYAPTNPHHVAPTDEHPPLIVMSHGGPTSEATPLFDLATQFWTSRGFAVVDVNYGGSAGFGRAYRQRLNGNWGVVDTMDCINAARHLAEQGVADGERLLIRGGSAGGYTTICALVFHDDFAAGATYYGIADLVPFAQGGTHKFESAYEHTLVGPWPEAEDLYRARSPINYVQLLSTPMLVLQGAEDEVVPPAQAELIVGALRDKELPHAYLLFEGEQHGFRNAETIVAAQHAELSFYAQILGFEPGDPIPRLEIENLQS
jgi:dipeptidyl aminopeptidase/acylaminoacyl peptidase